MSFFRLSLASVTNLWILGALCLKGALGFFFEAKVLLMTYFLTKALLFSPFSMLYNFLIPVTLLGPNLLGLVVSVNPGISLSPFLTKTKERALMSGPTMHPLTDFLLLYPVLLGL